MPENGEDAGKVQTIGARYAQDQITLEYAAEVGCRACATPGGGCQFLGTAATSQVVAEALGLSLTHSALAPSGQAVWLDAAARSARAILRMTQLGIGTADILTDAAIRNAMVVHAAFGGSTNLLLHVPAIAHAAGLTRPSADRLGRSQSRCSTVGGRATEWAQQFRNRSGVSRRRGAGSDAPSANRGPARLQRAHRDRNKLDENLNWWEQSERRRELKKRLRELDSIDASQVILSPDAARASGLTPTICFPAGNLAPEGSVIKSTAIDPSLIDEQNAYRHTGPARVFVTERAAIDAIKQGRYFQRRRYCINLRRTGRCRHAGNLPDHLGAEGASIL